MNKTLTSFVGISVFLIILLSGCNDLNPFQKDAGLVILYVDVDKSETMKDSPYHDDYEIPYYSYKLTVHIKNVGEEGSKVRIEAEHQMWMDRTVGWDAGATFNTDSYEIYLEEGESTSRLLTVSDFESFTQVSYRLYVVLISKESGDIYDTYEEGI